ncbi:hypothetical protein [Enterococcus rivorum]|uniref:Uncharacterized protein n=1 Tax=Enterococcus rivorum TaxID=762845 RepID=A0A1E5KZG8_9ENTE|nr:hypothetical protein [Enterococcus rivorum]MBP2099315.1 type II secretory pathway predicted ATPase ExeA [Enterococcus rivorum]OEH83302.1 hypothetical protein BCR26_10250 [Enterococcus rivorum]
MDSDCQLLATEFLAGLSPKEKTNLYNDLLALEDVHQLNQDITYYTFKNLKRVAKRHSERRKRSFQYINKYNNELLIHQIHEQHFFKNIYRIQIFINLQEVNYTFVECLLSSLRAPTLENMFTYQEISI